MKSSFEKKSWAFAIIVLFFGISIIPSMVAERPVLIETIYADDDSTEGLWDGTQEHPFQYMQNEFLDFMECIEDRSVVPRNLGGEILWGWWWPDFPGRFEPFFDVEEIGEFTSTATALTSADFNDDGLLDVALKWHNGPFDEDFKATITILYNKGEGNDFTREDAYAINYSRIEDLNAADYDTDGDIDLLFTYTENTEFGGKRNGTGWLLYNNGENEFIEKKNVFFHEYNPERKRINPHVTSADIDGDGDVDFLVGDNSGLVAFYKNDGTGDFVHVSDSDFDGKSISWGLDTADFDNDGYIDFIVTGGDKSDTMDGYIYVKYNDGSADCFSHDNYTKIVDLAVWEYESFYTTMFPIADGCINTIDYNNDELMDILYAGSGNLFLFIQQDSGVFEPFTIARFPGKKTVSGGFDSNNLRSGGITVGDFDGDGLDDAMIGGSHAIIRYFHNTHTLIDIVFPDRSCIVRNNEITRIFFPLYFPLKHGTAFVQGDITIRTQEMEPLSKVEFYLDDKLVFTDDASPYEWNWERFSFGRHKVKAVAYDLNGNEAGFDDTIVWKFL